MPWEKRGWASELTVQGFRHSGRRVLRGLRLEGSGLRLWGFVFEGFRVVVGLGFRVYSGPYGGI